MGGNRFEKEKEKRTEGERRNDRTKAVRGPRLFREKVRSTPIHRCFVANEYTVSQSRTAHTLDKLPQDRKAAMKSRSNEIAPEWVR
jgi:hypothetical protein